MIWFYKFYYQALMHLVLSLSNLTKSMSKQITKVAVYIANQSKRRFNDY